MNYQAGEFLERQLRDWWQQRGEEGEAASLDLEHLRRLLFRKTKYSVHEDLWFPGVLQEHQGVMAVVSETFVFRQLKEAIQLREKWLTANNLPLDTQMREGSERELFLKWAQAAFHAQDHQQLLQEADKVDGGSEKVTRQKNWRWNRELQRRLGTSTLWNMVTFTGRFDVEMLQTTTEAFPSCIPHTPGYMSLAHRARTALCHAQSLQRKKAAGLNNKPLTQEELTLTRDFASGKLQEAANNATRRCGWGRIKHKDGSFEDVAPHIGGITRTVLDDHVLGPENIGFSASEAEESATIYVD